MSKLIQFINNENEIIVRIQNNTRIGYDDCRIPCCFNLRYGNIVKKRCNCFGQISPTLLSQGRVNTIVIEM